jgi:hypothetical protein
VSTKGITFAWLTSLSMLMAGCGNVGQGPSPTIVRITFLEGASGAAPDSFGGTLNSDVTTIVTRNSVLTPTTFDDFARVTMAMTLKDPGSSGVTNIPVDLNVVTFTHYRVAYRRTDGRNTQGVDIPYAFDSGLTFSVSPAGTVQVGFEIVRHAAKTSAPLSGLQTSGLIISTIADVSFFGKDQAGNNVTVTGSIGINFGDFGDPGA